MRFFSGHKRRSTARRLLIEGLEERIVPSLADGTIIAVTSHSSFSSVAQDSFPVGLVGITPSTGAQFAISTGGLFSLPTYVAEAPDGQLYVTDLQAFTTGAIIRVDTNGGQHLVTRGGLLNGPNVLAYVNGFLYVANTGDGSGTVHSIVRVDPNTGQQTLLTSGGGFVVPTGMAVGPGNSIYVSDEPGGWSGSDPGGVWQVDCTTGAQKQITHGGAIVHASDVALDSAGNLLVMGATSPTDSVGRVVRINSTTGVQTVVPSDPSDGDGDGYPYPLYYLSSLAADAVTGTIYSGAISVGYYAANLFALDPATGNDRIVASGGLLSLVEGVRVYHAGLAPRPALQSVLSALPAMKTAATTSRDTNLLGDVIDQLTPALYPSRWKDDTHLIPSLGQNVFNSVNNAVTELFGMYNDPTSKFPKTSLLGVLNTLTQAVEQLAALALAEATARNGNATELALANQSLSQGQSDWNAGSFNLVVGDFAQAWGDAQAA